MHQKVNSFALALLEIAIEEKKLKEYKEQIVVIHEVLSENEEYMRILESHILDKEEKIKIVKEAFENKIEKLLLHFIFILIEGNNANLLLFALDKCKKYINDSLGFEEGIVYSVEKLTKDEILKIEESVSKKINSKVHLQNKLDATLISGICVIVNGKVIDNSISAQIRSLKEELLEGKVK